MFDPFFMGGGLDAEAKTRMVKMQNEIDDLKRSRDSHKEAFKKVNALLKECIQRLEAAGK